MCVFIASINRQWVLLGEQLLHSPIPVKMHHSLGQSGPTRREDHQHHRATDYRYRSGTTSVNLVLYSEKIVLSTIQYTLQKGRLGVACNPATWYKVYSGSEYGRT